MKTVNKSIPKIDGLGLILGNPVYTEDVSPKNALIVKVLRSPHAFARIKSIDTSEALKLSGVECVLTYKDVPRVPFTRAGQAYPEPSMYDKYILDEYVRHVGDDVAIVAAVDELTAEKALELIKVEYEVFEPVLDFEKAEGHKSVIHNQSEIECKVNVGLEADKNIAAKVDISMGDVDSVIKDCDVVIKKRYYSQAAQQAMLETFRSSAYIDERGRLVVIDSTQIPFHVRRFLSRALQIPASKIRVIKPRIGGGFGAKQTANSEFYTALVTLKTGKPSIIIYSQEETFEAGSPRHKMRLDVTIGADKGGKIRAIDLNGLSDTGAYGEHAYAVFLQAGMKSLNLYNKVEATRFKGNVVYTNLTSNGAFRGYGATQGIYALESAVNELAHELNMDPVEIRNMNMVRQGEPAIKFNFNGVQNTAPEDIFESCALDYCISRGKELIGWDEKYPKKVIDGNKVRGLGMAIGRQGSGIAKVDMGSATINLCDDGSFTLLVGATDLGTGSDTILSQICAEALGVSFDKINVISSDTDTTPFDGGAYASSTTYVTGNAVKKAADDMKKLIETEGARNLGVNIDKVEFDGRAVKVKGYKQEIGIEELATKLIYSQKQLVTSESFVAHKSPPPYMSGFAEVEVDLETGKVDVVNFAAVLDVGTVINPSLARVQAEGGIVQGIGMALYEDVKISSNGKLITNNLMNYKIPTRKDIGNITVEFAESYEPTGPFGAKSIGEVVINTSCPAIQDAIYNATGVRVRDLPITPEKVLKALKNK
jgi:putative selenate reductase molybdopterin-binding subunit